MCSYGHTDANADEKESERERESERASESEKERPQTTHNPMPLVLHHKRLQVLVDIIHILGTGDADVHWLPTSNLATKKMDLSDLLDMTPT